MLCDIHSNKRQIKLSSGHRNVLIIQFFNRLYSHRAILSVCSRTCPVITTAVSMARAVRKAFRESYVDRCGPLGIQLCTKYRSSGLLFEQSQIRFSINVICMLQWSWCTTFFVNMLNYSIIYIIVILFTVTK